MVNSFIISYYILILNCFLGPNMEVADNIAAVLIMPRKCVIKDVRLSVDQFLFGMAHLIVSLELLPSPFLYFSLFSH